MKGKLEIRRSCRWGLTRRRSGVCLSRDMNIRYHVILGNLGVTSIVVGPFRCVMRRGVVEQVYLDWHVPRAQITRLPRFMLAALETISRTLNLTSAKELARQTNEQGKSLPSLNCYIVQVMVNPSIVLLCFGIRSLPRCHCVLPMLCR